MEVKSHVQMPKGLMKAFSHRTENGRCVYYLDLKDMEIKEEKITELGTIKGLYNPTSEAILDRLYESPFFQVSQNVRKFSEEKITMLSLSKEDEAALISFIKMSLMRSNLAIGSAKNSSYIANLFPSIYHDLAILAIHNTLPDFKIFEGFRFNFLINKSAMGIVAPRNCIGNCTSNGMEFWAIPLTPEVAVLYECEELYKTSIDDNGDLFYAVVNKGDEEAIQSMNRQIAKTEIHFNNEFVISKNREELEILKSDLSGEPI